MSRLTLDLSNDVDKKLTEIAKRKKITKVEVMRRAFNLLSVADSEESKGNRMAVVDKDDQPVARLLNIL